MNRPKARWELRIVVWDGANKREKVRKYRTYRGALLYSGHFNGSENVECFIRPIM